MDSSCSGQPIHLWQFLKELLLKPHSYGRFIRWLNKEKGEWGTLPGHRRARGHRGNRRTKVGGASLGSYPVLGTRRGWAGRRGGAAPTFALKARHAALTG